MGGSRATPGAPPLTLAETVAADAPGGGDETVRRLGLSAGQTVRFGSARRATCAHDRARSAGNGAGEIGARGEHCAHGRRSERQLHWAGCSIIVGTGYIHLLADAVERGTELSIEPLGWDNTMAMIEQAMGEMLAGRLGGMAPVTEGDLDRLRRLRALGSTVLAGGERSPSLPTLARQCLQALLGPDWRTLVLESERSALALLAYLPPS